MCDDTTYYSTIDDDGTCYPMNQNDTITIHTKSSCRFCYAYTPPGFKESCCPPRINLTTMSSLSCVVNNSVQTTDQSRILTLQRDVLQASQQATTGSIIRGSTIVGSTIQSTIDNRDAITKQIESQLAQITIQRYQPYQPYIYPVVPASVTELAMKTANVGNPSPPITAASCKNFHAYQGGN